MQLTLGKSKTANTQSPGHATSIRGPLAALSISMLLPSLSTSIVNVGLPSLAEAFHAPFQQAQWVVLAYLLTVTSLIVSAGRLGDLFGRRRLLLGGILLFTAGSALCGFAPSLGALVAARGVQGLGAAIMMALSMALVAEAVPKTKTGAAIGLLGTMSAAGTALGPSTGGLLLSGLAWPVIFLMNVPMGLLALILVSRCLPTDQGRPAEAREKIDLLGTGLLALTLTAFALAMTKGGGGFGVWNGVLLMAAVTGAALFVLAQSRAAFPLIQLSVFQNPALSASFLMSALVTAVVMSTMVVGPFYLRGALGLNQAQTGMAMSMGPLVAALTGTPGGRLVDRLGSGRMRLAGLSGMLAGACAFSLLPAAWGLCAYLAPLAVVTGGYALFQAANNTSVLIEIQAGQRGVISALLNLSRNLGLIAGTSLMGAVFAFGASAAGILDAPPQALISGMRLTFIAATGLIFLALAVAAGEQWLKKR